MSGNKISNIKESDETPKKNVRNYRAKNKCQEPERVIVGIPKNNVRNQRG
jgi:hypothetical protein